MVDFGVTTEGFVLKRLADIKQDLVGDLSTVTDPISGETLTPDLDDEDDPLIQIVNSFADVMAQAWEELQNAYNQFDPLKAFGAGFSGVVQLNGLRRRAGSRSQVAVIVTGTPGVSFEANRQISTVNDYPVFELPSLVIGPGGTVSVIATCTEDGAVAANAGTLVKILTPVSGWTAVTNPGEATPGTLEETDEELRARQKVSTSSTGQTIVEAIASGVGELDGVSFVKMYQNVTLVEDERGIPPKCIAPVIQGGDDDEIAQVIFEKLAAGGADSFGDTEIEITDNQGIIYPIRFSRPTAIPIFVEIELTVVNSNVWPSDGADLITAAIISWATLGAQSLGIGSATQYDQDGYLPGQSVYASELYVPCNSVAGIKIDSIVIGVAESPTEDEVIISWNEIAEFSSANISITVAT